ncbi:putative gpi anchored serine-threonine rich protein [Phaeoacremonium minimum UCRPA7]|uniref:Putative gpi anchored serine-threonine rich protein n=1 Tax=Phaeoacremonium minimum (strain UCR-PA7) TaxID=1286976 RepID=R8BF50_PHAM7|nr:putative gpi anchored serine-threonine rich protein [Phaeoacremonium minimum UCRPA7]EON97919.1 putative gpi anchored serine-threonine rich protein [Phaeoacremonium minimum UCRPA7]
MRFTVSAAALLAFAAKVLAQDPTADFDPILTPGEGETLDAGSTYKITWETVDKYNGTATIILMGGKTENTLELLDPVASSIDNSAGEYDWKIASDLGADATYGLKIQWDSDETIFQYSFPFAIEGSGASSSSSASGSGTATVTSTVTSASASGTSGSSSTGSVAETITSTITSESGIPTASSNLSTTGSPATTVTSVVVPSGSGTGSSASASPTTVTDNGAAKLTGSFIALSGLVAAALLL